MTTKLTGLIKFEIIIYLEEENHLKCQLGYVVHGNHGYHEKNLKTTKKNSLNEYLIVIKTNKKAYNTDLTVSIEIFQLNNL